MDKFQHHKRVDEWMDGKDVLKKKMDLENTS